MMPGRAAPGETRRVNRVVTRGRLAQSPSSAPGEVAALPRDLDLGLLLRGGRDRRLVGAVLLVLGRGSREGDRLELAGVLALRPVLLVDRRPLLDRLGRLDLGARLLDHSERSPEQRLDAARLREEAFALGQRGARDRTRLLVRLGDDQLGLAAGPPLRPPRSPL